MRRYTAFLCTVASLAIGCGSGVSSDPPTTYVATVEPILARECAPKCHEPGVKDSGFMDLRAGHARASLVGVPSEELPTMVRVKPGDLEASYMWHKLQGTQKDVGGDGERMPYASTLTPKDLASVQQWI